MIEPKSNFLNTLPVPDETPCNIRFYLHWKKLFFKFGFHFDPLNAWRLNQSKYRAIYKDCLITKMPFWLHPRQFATFEIIAINGNVVSDKLTMINARNYTVEWHRKYLALQVIWARTQSHATAIFELNSLGNSPNSDVVPIKHSLGPLPLELEAHTCQYRRDQ